jgi:hypothetical protein
MTVSERSVWVQLFVMPLVAVAYFSVVLSRATGESVAEISWIVPMIWSMGIVVLGIILGTIASAIGSAIAATARGDEPDLEEGDQRDKEIERLGNRKAQFFTGIGTIAVIVLAMFRVDPFWIASTMFLAGIVAGIHGAIAKLVAYRRGF